MGDYGALAASLAQEPAEVVCLVVESAGGEGLVKLDDTAVEIVDGGAGGVPPVGVNEYVAARCGEDGVAAAEQIESGVELGHAVAVLGLDEGEGVNARGADAAHDLHALEIAEPGKRKEGLVRADAHDAAAGEFGEEEGVAGRARGVGVAGAHKADGADGVGFEVGDEAAVEREEGRLHGFHEEAIGAARGVENIAELDGVERGGFFAEDVLAGLERLDAEGGVAVRVRGYVDGVDGAVGEAVEGERVEDGKDTRDVEFLREGRGFFWIAAPDGFEVCSGDGLQSLSKAGTGAAWADDAPADDLRRFC